ncbi:MAG: lipoyl domain-containing protein, partial [Actinomycetota bacterium]|nr:lipoyl domain-containing protein [Actinomycetota bacterium]
MSDVVMPRLSDSMEEGTILRWLKREGEQVRRGEELVEIETDKATMTYEADEDGPLSILAAEGATLPIGKLIARIGGATPGNGREPEAAAQPAPAVAPAVASPVPVADPPSQPAGGGRVKASP